MEDMIIDFFELYGWKLTLIALSGIVLLGILKMTHMFDKVPKTYRKYVYAGVSSGLSIIAAAIYLLCTDGFVWKSFALVALAIYALNQFAYALYENTGLRAGLRKIGAAVLAIFKRSHNNIVKSEDEKDKAAESNDGAQRDPFDIPLE